MRGDSVQRAFRSCRVSAAAILVAAPVLLSACSGPEAPLGPAAIVPPGGSAASSQPADRCVNVSAEGTAALGLVTLPNGTTGFGGVWFPLTLGGIAGEMASVVVGQEVSGGGQQGALHLSLEHAFRTPGGDYLITKDRAVCAPAGTNPARCHVNDVLTIVEGTGIFSNANGSLRNHGTVDFAQNSLEFSIRGRLCGDGI